MKRNYLALAPLIGFLTSSLDCNDDNRQPPQSVQQTHNISTASTLEEILCLESLSVQDFEKDHDKPGLYNLNSGDLKKSDFLVVIETIPKCPACFGWTKETIAYLAKNKHMFNPEKTSVIVIKGADEYFARQDYPSYPVLEIMKKEGRKWESKGIDWGIDKPRPKRFFENVEHYALRKPLPQDEIVLTAEMGKYQILWTTEDNSSMINESLARKIPFEYYPNYGFVVSLDLQNPQQLKQKLKFSSEFPKKWGQRKPMGREFKAEMSYFFSPDEFNLMDSRHQREFKKEQDEFVERLESETRESLSRSPRLLELFDLAVESNKADFEGTSTEYTFPVELGNKTKREIESYFNKELKGGKNLFYQQSAPSGTWAEIPKNVTSEDEKRLKDKAERTTRFYNESDELGVLVFHSNIPGGLLRKILDREERVILFQFDGSDISVADDYFQVIRDLKNARDNYTFVLIEKGDSMFRVPLPSTESEILETPNIGSSMIIDYEGRIEYLYSGESLMEKIIKEKQR